MPTFSLFTFQKAEFNTQFRCHFGDGFQDWFAKLARKLHPNGDVQSIRLTQGDGKLDVAVLTEQLVYQCYAPSDLKFSLAAAKIKEDFWGAFHHLDGALRKWVFVHNHPTGQLDKGCYKELADIVAKCQRQGNDVKVLAWGVEQLWIELETGLSFSDLRDLFGSPERVTLDFATLEELLLALERAYYPADVARLPLPDERKLEFNDLGPVYQREIREGRNGLRVMDGYLASRAASDPEFGEKLAQRFRDRYALLKSRGLLSANEVYESLRLDAGWKASPDAIREMATRTILAYFFDACDIFENAPTQP